MTRTGRLPIVVGGMAIALALGACTPEEPAPPPPSPSASSSHPESPSATTPTPTPTPSSDPTKEAVAEAEAAYKEFLTAYTEWMLAGSPKGLTPKLQKLASKEAGDEIELAGDASRGAGVLYKGGPMVIVSLKSKATSLDHVSISTCVDQSKFASTRNGQPDKMPRWFHTDTELTRTDGRWIVTEDGGLPAKNKKECAV